jgi:phage head maturation protease
MDTKSLRVSTKTADQGEVEAVFSTFDVVDRDGDITLKEAITDGSEVIISAYSHKLWEGALPVGMGTVHVTDTEAILKGRFFLDTTAGRETFAVVKALGDRQEWSYGFTIEDSEPTDHKGQKVRVIKKTAVHEVSPVFIGAGVNTRTTSAKSADVDKTEPELNPDVVREYLRSLISSL